MRGPLCTPPPPKEVVQPLTRSQGRWATQLKDQDKPDQPHFWPPPSSRGTIWWVYVPTVALESQWDVFKLSPNTLSLLLPTLTPKL